MCFATLCHRLKLFAVSVVLFLSAFLLSSCGGGGGGSSSNTSTPPSQTNPAPTVTSVSPSSATAGSTTTTVTVNGSGFIQGSTVQWNQSACTTTFVSSTQLQAAITAAELAAAGTAQVTVVNPTPGGGTSAAAAFAVNNPVPAITSLSQTTVAAGASSLSITVTGTGFVQTSTVQWNQSNRPTTFVSSTQLQVALTAADLASGANSQLTVVNSAPGGGTSPASTFTVTNPVPQIASISPTTVTTIDGGSTLTVTGSGFVPTSAITWNGSSRSTTYVNSTQLQTALLASDVAAVGSAQISVSNVAPGGGTASNASLTIVYPVPVITSLNPPAVVAGSAGFVLNVSGRGFSPSSAVQFNGTSRSTTYVNSTLLRIGVSTTDIATPGSAQITVVTGAPGGGTSSPATLTIGTYPVPAITSVYPPSINVNSPDTSASLQGSGFISFSTVQVNGSNVSVNGWSTNSLLFTIPASDLTSVGTLSITVTNPGPSVSNTVTINVAPNPVPTLSYLTPNSAAAGSAALTLSVTGSNFVPTSVVQWNGVNRSTTYVNNFQLTINVSAADLQSLGNNVVTVNNPAPGGGTSSALAFTTYLPLPTNDLVFNSTTGLLYASIPSSAGPSLGNSIVSIDPNTGVLGTPIFVGSEPGRMALSSDGSVLWVALTGAGAVRQVNLTTQTAGMQFALGGGSGIYNPPLQGQLLAVVPGSPNSIAVETSNGIVTIYDSGVARSKTTSQANFNVFNYGNGGLVFDSTGSKLYVAGSGYGLLTVDSTGITSATLLNSNVSSTDLRIDSGRAYLTSGVVLNADTGLQLGVFSVASNQNANGPVAPDSAIGRAFVLTNPNYGQSYQVNAYELATFVFDGSVPVSTTYATYSTNPVSLIRWGQDGLAFRNGSQVYVFRSALVRDLSSSLADLSVSASAPANGTTGTDLNYTLTVSNAGPVDATVATLVDTIPNGSVLKIANPSRGTCSGAAVVRCNLGTIASGSSATVQIAVTPLSPGTATNTAVVSAPQGDPNTGNNTASFATTVTGNTVNPVPTISSISPAFVKAGSASFTLQVNGSGFTASSSIQLNGNSVATTFVSASQLTATVDATNVAVLGWAAVAVANPSPGGGASSTLPLTVFTVVSLDTNHLSFDPFTRKLYATIPSTATQVMGNTLVAIDPATGSLGSPLFVGSGPNKLVESPDGKYLYIGLDGQLSVTRVDINSMTQGSTYPITYTASGSPGSSAARDIAVAPGNDDTVAVDTGGWTGTGIYDITGSTWALRGSLTGTYTGSYLVFKDASTLYLYNLDTWGTFDRWSLGSSGLTKIDSTTLLNIGGRGPFKLVGNRIYGSTGGVADATTAIPAQLGEFQVQSAEGSAQDVEGDGVAPDPAAGRVFFLGETLAGTANPVLLAYDSNSYELLQLQEFTGYPQGADLVRWGRDGLAWRTSNSGAFGNPTAGTGELIIVRGPFVLPQWSNSNPTPGLTATNPTSANHGSGNLTIAVTGSSFVPGAVVLWNNNERTTTFVDSSHLTVAIPASDLAQAGTATVVVNNPGSSNSGSVSFTIQ